MKTLYIKLSLALLLCSGLSHAAPDGSFTFQGKLSDGANQPVTGTRFMEFTITDGQNGQPKWRSGAKQVQVTNGYFSQVLKPAPPLDWEQIDPWVEAAVGADQSRLSKLGPAQQITGNVFASLAGNVVSDSISEVKLSSSVRESLVPSGAILMFAKACPAIGWTRFSQLDNKFPRGSATYDAVGGGAPSHAHSLNLSDHTHVIDNNTLKIAIGIRNINYDNNLVMIPAGGVGSYSTVTNGSWYGYGIGMAHPAPVGTNPGDVSVSGPRIWGDTGSAAYKGANLSDSQSNEPPFVGIVYCQKL
jgi:hypothetical protein